MTLANRNEKGTVFNIQKFSVNDGPGIRTVVFLKGCPLHCLWCANPESQMAKPQVFWDIKKCTTCLTCKSVCSKNAIELVNDHIHINHCMCDGCSKCISSCPNKALELEGKIMNVQEVIDVVLQDKVFYEEGGGITLSGGEIFTQPEFSKQLLIASKEEGLHTCCETTGFIKKEIFEEIIEYVDYIFFDVKHYDDTKHKLGTGVSNKLILSNLEYLASLNKTLLPRIPVIPDFNDSLNDAKEFSNLFNQLNKKKCHLLPFHQFGENKYHLLNKEYKYQDTPSLHKEDLLDYQNIFIENGIDAFF